MEIEWVRQAGTACAALRYYYMGYYIHTCHRMRYKVNRSWPALPVVDSVPQMAVACTGSAQGTSRTVHRAPVVPTGAGRLWSLGPALPQGLLLGASEPRAARAGAGQPACRPKRHSDRMPTCPGGITPCCARCAARIRGHLRAARSGGGPGPGAQHPGRGACTAACAGQAATPLALHAILLATSGRSVSAGGCQYLPADPARAAAK